MLDGRGCNPLPVVIDGVEYKRIKVGDSGDWLEGHERATCGDCGAETGYYHHAGCDCERCPVCGGQLISCDCLLDGEDPDEEWRPAKPEFDTDYWHMTNKERAEELFKLFKKAEELVSSGGTPFLKMIDTGADYSPLNCVRYGLQGATQLVWKFKEEKT